MSRQLSCVTCRELWPDLIIICHVRVTHIFSRFGLWVHKPPVKRVLAHPAFILLSLVQHEDWRTLKKRLPHYHLLRGSINGFLHRGPTIQNFDVSLLLAWTIRLRNTLFAGNFRRYHAHWSNCNWTIRYTGYGSCHSVSSVTRLGFITKIRDAPCSACHQRPHMLS